MANSVGPGETDPALFGKVFVLVCQAKGCSFALNRVLEGVTLLEQQYFPS